VADPGGATTFTSNELRRAKAIGCVLALGLSVFILFQMSRNPTTLVKGYMVVLGLVAVGLVVCLVRAFRVGIVLTDDAVIARTTLSTKTFAWDDIAEAISKDRRRMGTGQNFVAITRQAQQRIQVIPQLRLTSGRLVQLYGLQVTIPSSFDPNWLDDAINEINSRLAARRGQGAAPPSHG
jgi:hypothetical protein